MRQLHSDKKKLRTRKSLLIFEIQLVIFAKTNFRGVLAVETTSQTI